MLKKYAIIVAGGKGERMNSEIPKQFILLLEKPILMHTIGQFKRYDKQIDIVLVLPQNQMDYWEKLCNEYSFTIKHRVVAGGQTRFQSVKNGLNTIPQKEQSLVAIHDGVRPLVDIETIGRCFDMAQSTGVAIPTIEVTDSLRQIDEKGSKIVNRNNYRLVQTPQVFLSQTILKSYKQDYNPLFTDDASVVESWGKEVTLVEGNKKNIKITTKEDLEIATVWLKAVKE